jgi:hypothetical protein
MPLYDRAVSLLNQLVLVPEIKGRRLAIVAHSFGGLLTKQIVRTAVDRPDIAGSFLEHLAGSVFVATPHQGSKFADYADALSRVLGTTTIVESLRAHEPHIRELGDWYRNQHEGRKLRSLALRETDKTRVQKWGLGAAVLVVDESSSDPHIPGVNVIPIDADHFSIAKPASSTAHQYQAVLDFLSGIQSVIPAGRQPAGGWGVEPSMTADIAQPERPERSGGAGGAGPITGAVPGGAVDGPTGGGGSRRRDDARAREARRRELEQESIAIRRRNLERLRLRLLEQHSLTPTAQIQVQIDDVEDQLRDLDEGRR